MISLLQAFRCFALLLSVALAGCASLDKYSFETFGRPKQQQEIYANEPRSDKLALVYADYVAQLLEGRSTGARLTREGSDSALVVGAALAAAQQTLEISAETIAGIGLGTVILRELPGIFNARGRSEAFADAAYLIRQAQSEYRQYNPNPSPDYLTENGAILVSRVDAALHAARKSLNGRLPGLLDLQQATQPMTKAGADRESSGTPQTIFTASGVRERVAKAVTLKVREPESVSREEFERLESLLNKQTLELPQNIDFVAGLRKIRDSAMTEPEKTALWVTIVADAGLTGKVEPNPNAMNRFFQREATAAQKSALTTALNKHVPSN